MFVNFYKEYGDDFAKCYFKNSDTVIEILTKYGDEGATGLKANNDTFVDLYVTHGDKFVEDYLKYQDEAVETYLKYIDNANAILKGESEKVILRKVDEIVDSVILERVNQKKMLLPSALKKTPNAGYADVSIEGLAQNDFFAHSGVKNINELSDVVQNRIGNISPEATESEFVTLWVNKQNVVNGEGAWNRIVDSESKILEDINSKIQFFDNPTGKIILYTDLKPCPSCTGVINQFKKKYPNIEIEIIYIK